jgi:hypothetical protein
MPGWLLSSRNKPSLYGITTRLSTANFMVVGLAVVGSAGSIDLLIKISR